MQSHRKDFFFNPITHPFPFAVVLIRDDSDWSPYTQMFFCLDRCCIETALRLSVLLFGKKKGFYYGFMKIKKSLDRSLWTETNGFIFWNLLFFRAALSAFLLLQKLLKGNLIYKVLNFSQLKHSLAICLVILKKGNVKLLFCLSNDLN